MYYNFWKNSQIGLPFEIRIDIRISENIRKVDSKIILRFECPWRFESHFDFRIETSVVYKFFHMHILQTYSKNIYYLRFIIYTISGFNLLLKYDDRIRRFIFEYAVIFEYSNYIRIWFDIRIWWPYSNMIWYLNLKILYSNI